MSENNRSFHMAKYCKAKTVLWIHNEFLSEWVRSHTEIVSVLHKYN
jgi:hypothetical protein